MAEYIEREALLKHYRALANIEWNKTVAPISWCDAYEEIADHIAELPTADVVPKSEVENILAEIREAFEKYGGQYGMKQRIVELEQKYGLIDCADCRYFVGCECFDGKVCGDFKEKDDES